jgi:capsular polysaccharide biosynthesis protein
VKTLLVRAITASLLAAVVVTLASLMQTPTYEASAVLLVGQKELSKELSEGKIHLIPLAPAPERLQRLQQLTHTMLVVIESRPVAEGTIRRLGVGVSPADLLNNLTAEQVEASQFIRLSYTDTDPARAKEVVNAVGRESSEFLSATAGANGKTATLFEKASVPDAPASPRPLRNGLIALVAALAFSAALFEARRRAQMDEEQER